MNAQNIIEKIGRGNMSETARKLKVPLMTLADWKKRNRIPHWRHDHIKQVASELGVSLEA